MGRAVEIVDDATRVDQGSITPFQEMKATKTQGNGWHYLQ